MTRRIRYSAEFKREALRRANEEGVTVSPDRLLSSQGATPTITSDGKVN